MTNPNQCARLQNDLKAYADGQLSVWKRRTLARHLATCEACRKEMESMARMSKALREGERDSLDAGLRARLLAAVPDGKPEPGPIRPLWKRPPLLAWGAMASAVTLWVVFAPLASHGFFGPNVARTGEITSAEKSVGLAFQQYAQDYDETFPKSFSHSATPLTARAASSAARRTMSAPGATPPLAGAERAEAFAYDKQRPAKSQAMLSEGINGKMASPDNKFASPAKPASPLERGRSMGGVPGSADVAGESGLDEREVHKEASITIEVGPVEAKSEEMERYVKSIDGFVANNQLSTGDNELKSSTLTLKVPVARFEDTLRQAASLGEVKAKSINGEDITEKLSDQVQTEHALKDEIGSTQAKLTQPTSRREGAENRETLRQLRIRHAQAQARLVMLRKLGALSTIVVTLNEKPKPQPAPPIPPTPGFFTDMGETLHDAMRSLTQAARLPIVTLIWILAYAPVWLLLVFGYRYAARR